MLKSLKEFIYGHIGSWSYFVGSCIADGFRDRMDELDEEEILAGQQQDEEWQKVQGGKPDQGHGVNWRKWLVTTNRLLAWNGFMIDDDYYGELK